MAGKNKRNQAQKEEDHLEDSEEPMSKGDFNRMIVGREADRRAEEERAEARLIAAEERAEKRRKAEKIEEEERAERRAEARLKREREEKREADERAETRAEKLMEQQQAMADRQFKQQEQLMKLQADISATAANERRLEQEMSKKRDRAVLSIGTYKDSEDIEEYLMTAERKLRAGEVPEGEWLTHIAAKLTGKMGTTWQDLCVDVTDYHEVKAKLLKICGYTPKVAAELFFGFKSEQIRGMTADQVYLRGVQLFRRLIAPHKVGEDAEFSILKGWVSYIVPRKAKVALDMRTVDSVADLLGALHDHLMLEGDRTEGQAVVFGRQGHAHGSEVREERKGGSGLTCYKCGKPGHKAVDCWQVKGGTSSVSKPAGAPSSSSSSAKVITCYTCGEEGHKSPQCPRIKKEKVIPKDGVAKPVRQLGQYEPTDTVMEGTVNGRKASVLLDSGASITVVPEAMVEPELLTGSFVSVRAFQSKDFMTLPTARVNFCVENLEWEELAALAPVEKGREVEVLYSLDLTSERGVDLVLLANKLKRENVLRVTTRSEAKKAALVEKQEALVVSQEKPVARPIEAAVVDSVVCDLMSLDECRGESDLAVDRPVSDLEPGASDITMGNVKESELSLDVVEVDSEVTLDDELDASGESRDGSVQYKLRARGRGEEEFMIPPVLSSNGSRTALVEETKSDPTLKAWRELAEKGEQGFVWQEDLLYQATTTHTFETIHLMVLPTSFRAKVLDLTHERSGHLGARKVKALIKQRFVWPGMGQAVIDHCRSCKVCQTCSKSSARRVPLMEREVLTEPFEVIAFDLVGPLPKGKGGCRFVLTAIDMASKWPEAIPLRSITARAVAQGMVEVFSRTGIPLQLLTDQGSQFIGSLVSHLCRDLNIDKVKTTPYHPETNGVVERMHGTLGAMLTKASALGLDWVGQLPFAMFALRSAPNRDSHFSPFQLVYGHRVRTPLDILHQGWAELQFQEMDTAEWSSWLADRLEIWHDVLRERGECASYKRKEYHDKKAVDRQLSEGDLVLCRIPGMSHKLQEAWHGPYSVVERKNRVNYKVDLGKGRRKVLHINNLKKFYPREEEVMRLAVVAEDWEEDVDVGMKMSGMNEDFNQDEVAEMKREYPEVFSDLPGKTNVCKLQISTGDALPVASHPYRIPDRLKEGVRDEVQKLMALGIAVPSQSPWASPVVPVPKSDGSVRVCVDFRRLNELTISDPYYMVTLEEILERVGNSSVVSKLDLCKGFYQIEVEEASMEKTAFITPFGKFQFTRMPFGLKNAPAVFQRTMEVVLNQCYEYSAPYIDDIVVFSKRGAEHSQHLRKVFNELRKFGLTVKEAKCEFGKLRLEYLGHIIGGGVLAVPEHRAAAMADFIQPKTKKQLRSFLGAASYYRKFVKGYANMSSVLSPATSKPAPSVVQWNKEMLEAFNAIKVCLVHVCVLTIPSQEDIFVLHTDASGAGIGATLNVIRDGEERPAAYFSRQLQGAQQRYSATELEGLAIFKSILFFAHFLFGRHFTVVTDHKALVSFLHSRVLNKRLHGWMLQLLEYDFSIVYRPGAMNQDADALSRQAWNSSEGDPWLWKPRRAS